MSDRKVGYFSLNVENKRGVTNGVMFAYAHEKINILLSVLSILSFFFFLSCLKKGKRKVQGVPQSQSAALPRPEYTRFCILRIC